MSVEGAPSANPVTLNTFIERAMLTLLALLALTGIWMAAGIGALAPGAMLHAVAAGGILALAAARVAVLYVGARYRADPAGWLRAVGLLAALLALHVTGGALLGGEPGAEGRAHIGAAAGIAAPSVTLVLAAHALLLAPLAAFLLLRSGAPVPGAAGRVALAVLVASVVPATALALTAPPPIPEVEGAEAARTPWAVRALEPLEAWLGLRVALALGAVSLLALALLPLAERGVPTRRAAVTAALLLLIAATLALGVVAAFLPAAHHLEVAA